MGITQYRSTERKLTKNKSAEMKSVNETTGKTLATLIQREEEGEAERQGGGHYRSHIIQVCIYSKIQEDTFSGFMLVNWPFR